MDMKETILYLTNATNDRKNTGTQSEHIEHNDGSTENPVHKYVHHSSLSAVIEESVNFVLVQEPWITGNEQIRGLNGHFGQK